MTKNDENDSNINAEKSLGKGEVDSSILSGSTRNTHKIGVSDTITYSGSAVPSRTQSEHDISTSGKSVDSVPQVFRIKTTQAKVEKWLEDHPLGSVPDDLWRAAQFVLYSFKAGEDRSPYAFIRKLHDQDVRNFVLGSR